MNKTDYLYHDQMIVKCNSAIALLNQDIADIETLKEKLNSIITEGKLKGQSIVALKENLRDYFICIGLILSADKSDKNGLKRLKRELRSQTDYNGPIIWKHFEEARAKMKTAEATASDFRIKERSYSPPWYYDEDLDKWLQSDDPNPYTSKVRHYEDIADTERKIMEAAQRKMKEFDSFATDTMGYLSAGKEIRKTVSETFALMKTQKEGGIYSPGVAKVYLNKLLLSDNSYLKNIANSIIGSEEYGDYLIDFEFYDDEDVKELMHTNEIIDYYYTMVCSDYGDSSAKEAAKKNMNLDDLMSKKKQIIEKIVSKMDHSDVFMNAYNFAKVRNYSADQMEELMWHWAKIDDMDVSQCSAIPESWEKNKKHYLDMSRWVVLDNPSASYYYCANYLDYYTFSYLINESGTKNSGIAGNMINAEKVLQNEIGVNAIYNYVWYEKILKESQDALDSKIENIKQGLESFDKSALELSSYYGLVRKVLSGEFSKDIQSALASELLNSSVNPAPTGNYNSISFANTVMSLINEISSDSGLVSKVSSGEFSKDIQLAMASKLLSETINFLVNPSPSPTGNYNSINFSNTVPSLINDIKTAKETVETKWDTLMKNVVSLPGEDINNVYNLFANIPILNSLSKSQIDYQSKEMILGWKDYTYKCLDTSPYPKDGKFYIENQHHFNTDALYGKYLWPISEVCMSNDEDWGKDYYFDKEEGLYGAHNLCEVIAVYNVMTFLEDDEVDFPQIVKDFVSKSPVIGGNFGTSPDCVEEYLNYQGYKTETIDVESLNHNPNGEDDFDALLEKYDAFILSDWNTDKADDAMHTMAITVKKETDSSGGISYTIVRHNDFHPMYNEKENFSTGYTSEDLYKLLCEYTYNNDTKKNEADGVIKVTGVIK